MTTVRERIDAFVEVGALLDAADLLDETTRGGDRSFLPELRDILDQLAFEDAGVRWRYIPAGTFTMGDDLGELDEAPAHPVTLPGFWMSEAPLALAELGTALAARGSRDPSRLNRGVPLGAPLTDRIPLVGIDVETAMEIARGKGGRLPSEAEFERAARGTLNGAHYPWGDAAPRGDLADFDAFDRPGFTARPIDDRRPQASRTFPPNDYGLFSMAGGVWQWCTDVYDAEFYASSPRLNPVCHDVVRPPSESSRHVMRGGSFVDSPAALRVAFRGATHSTFAPMIGLRIVRDLDTTGIGAR